MVPKHAIHEKQVVRAKVGSGKETEYIHTPWAVAGESSNDRKCRRQEAEKNRKNEKRSWVAWSIACAGRRYGAAGASYLCNTCCVGLARRVRPYNRDRGETLYVGFQ